ncbi:hypothetical protein BX600DRAFT_438866 [Xylariales sp. PMI_506]|nr:hypothetical protein BX600DRAFT_438866 [Xylariales sp. PMI_506]
MYSVLLPAAVAALSYSASVSAGAIQTCPTTDVCYSVAVPDSSAASDSGNIYFQITAPTTYSWVALGTGTHMDASNMFVMYQDGAGNVTLSPRAGTDHTTPSEDTSSDAAQLTLLAGSGVSGDTMTANVLCSNCNSWEEGTLNLAGTSTSWIAAWKSGSSLATTDKDAKISQHDDTSQFTLDLTQATITTDANPFTGNTTTTSASTTAGSSSTTQANPKMLVYIHGVIMTAVMVFLYPMGSMLMPLFGKWFIHAGWQLFAYVLMWAGFAVGVVVAQDLFIICHVQNFKSTHTQLGTAIVALFGIQPVLGWLHHMHYVKYQQRGIISYVHIFYGGALIMLGIINGGLGLKLASAPTYLISAYAIASCVVLVVYTAVKAVSFARAQRHRPDMVRKMSKGSAHSESHELPNRTYRRME